MGDDEAVGNGESDLELVKDQWTKDQLELGKLVVETDGESVKNTQYVSYFGGLDISFIIGDPVNACACYVVLNR